MKAAKQREVLKILSIERELRARRVKWLQNVTGRPEENVNMLAALTCRFGWEQIPQVDDNGWATKAANPWLVQFLCDLSKVAEVQHLFATQFAQQRWFAISARPSFCSSMLANSENIPTVAETSFMLRERRWMSSGRKN